MTTTHPTASERSSCGSTLTIVTVLAAVTGSLLASSRVRTLIRTGWERAERDYQTNRLYARGLFATTTIPNLPAEGRVVWTGAR